MREVNQANGKTPREFPPKLPPSRGFPSRSEPCGSTEMPAKTEASTGRSFLARGGEPRGLVPGLPLRGGPLTLRSGDPSGSP